MSVREILRTVHQRDPALSVAGWIHVVLLWLMILALPFDSREILGLNPWIKPMKFAVSIALFLWTMAWFLAYLPGPKRTLQIIRWGVAGTMLIEIFCISLQSARGVPSHYNTATAFDGIVFGIMGLMIVLNSLLVFGVLFLFLWEEVDLPAPYLMGIRFGLALFLAGSLEGMVMILNQAHTIGAADGGAGLPFINWSTKAGDLRAAHAAGIHAMQILPLIGHAISRWFRNQASSVQMLLLVAASFGYVSVMVYLFSLASQGKPLLAAGF
jgi:hypothetical protein